jgi:hypothetical protein
MTTRDISEILERMYGHHDSPQTIRICQEWSKPTWTCSVHVCSGTGAWSSTLTQPIFNHKEYCRQGSPHIQGLPDESAHNWTILLEDPKREDLKKRLSLSRMASRESVMPFKSFESKTNQKIKVLKIQILILLDANFLPSSDRNESKANKVVFLINPIPSQSQVQDQSIINNTPSHHLDVSGETGVVALNND